MREGREREKQRQRGDGEREKDGDRNTDRQRGGEKQTERGRRQGRDTAGGREPGGGGTERERDSERRGREGETLLQVGCQSDLCLSRLRIHLHVPLIRDCHHM